MKHPHGIEVYLKPRRESGDELRFPELTVPDDDPMRKRCCVPIIEGKFVIVIKFSKDFNLSTANSMFNGGAYRYLAHNQLDGQLGTRGSQVAGHQTVVAGFHGENFWLKEPTEEPDGHSIPMTRQGHRSKGPFGNGESNGRYNVASDTMLVYLRRGNYDWSQVNGPLQDTDFSKGRPSYLAGQIGKDYVFEFHLRPKASIKEYLNNLQQRSSLHEPSNSATMVDLVPDLEYQKCRTETLRLRAELKAAWDKNKQSEVSKRRPVSKQTVQPCPSTCGCQRIPRASTRSKPTAQFNRSSQNFRDSDRETGQHDVATDTTDDTIGEISTVVINRNAPDISNESAAQTCTQCRKLKKAPRGKKIAWRKRTGKWMYVHKNAPDESGPLVEGEDEDDDEPLPTPKAEPAGSQAAVQESTQRDGNLPDLINTDINHAHEFDNGMAPAEPEVTDAVPAISIVTSTEGAQDQQQKLGSGPDDAQSAKQNEAGKDNESSTLFVEEENHPTQDTAAAEPATTSSNLPATPPDTPSAPSVDGKSKKRANESGSEAPVSKKARVDIDLTIDDDDDPVVVKAEMTERGRIRKADQEKTKNLQKKLEEVRRRKQILELEEEEARLENQLAEEQGNGQGARIKEEGAVKIEE